MNRITAAEALVGKLTAKRMRLAGADLPSFKGRSLYVDSVSGANTNNGRSWDKPFSTLQYAITKAQDHDTIWLSGRFDTQGLFIPVGLDYLKIRSGSPSFAAAHLENNGEGAAVITCYAQGLYLEGLMIEAPSNAAGVHLVRAATKANANATGAILVGCDFWTGLYGVFLDGAPDEFHMIGGSIRNMRATGAVGMRASAPVASAYKCKVYGVHFQGNVEHLHGAFSDSVFRACQFSHQAVGSNDTTTKIDLREGDGNMLIENQLGGTYSHTGGYWEGPEDNWNGNYGSSGITSAVPA